MVAQPGQNISLPAPLEVIPVHLRGGTIIAAQTPANTTKHTRMNPWSITIALDINQAAAGELYLDDGLSLQPADTKVVQVSYPSCVISIFSC